MMPLVSVIMPVFNAAKYLEEAFASILNQTWKESLEISIFNDASTDNSTVICDHWSQDFLKSGISVLISHNKTGKPCGVGFAKNQAIRQSNGKYLCFFDADDVMLPQRIEMQLKMAKTDETAIIGSCYTRIPESSTQRYTIWSNTLSQEQLYAQVYTSFGPTLINPTWFCSRKVFDVSGMFCEIQDGFPEDLEFYYRHLECNGKLIKIEIPLLIYRYHHSSASFNVHENTIWNLRVKQLQKHVLSAWTSFTIWNAGKQGRKFYKSLTKENRCKVVAMCDVDKKKIDKGFYNCDVFKNEECHSRIPIIHFSNAIPPFIICVKLNLSNGSFEENLKTLNLMEGIDYYHFN